jgi:hypothetical protein
MIIALAFILGSAGAEATQNDTIWVKKLNGNYIKDCHFTPSGDSIVAIAGADDTFGDTVYIIQTSTGNIIKQSHINFGCIAGFSLFHTKPNMLLKGTDKIIRIYDYVGDSVVTELFPGLGGFAINSNDSIIIFGYVIGYIPNYTSKLYKYNVAQNSFIDSIDIPYYTSSPLAISNDNQYLATGAYSQDNDANPYDKLLLRRLDNWEIIKDFNPIPAAGVIADIEFSPDSKYIGVASHNDGSVKVYRTDSLDVYRSFVPDSFDKEGPVSVHFSNNSNFIIGSILVINDLSTKIWDITNNDLFYSYPTASYQSLDISPNETIIAANLKTIVLLAPKWLSVPNPPQESKDQASSYIISKSNNQRFTIKSRCNNLASCRLYDVYGNSLSNENIFSLIDNGNISINPAQLNTGVYFLAVGMERVVKVLVVE